MFYCLVQEIRNKVVAEVSIVVKFSKIKRNNLQFQKTKHILRGKHSQIPSSLKKILNISENKKNRT